MPAFAQALTFFCTRDLAASERFYGATLGLPVAMRTPTAILWQAAGSAYFGVTSGPGREPKAGAAIFELVTHQEAEVQDWYARIVADGWQTDGPPRRTEAGATCFFATDPNGYLVEILHFADPSPLGPAWIEAFTRDGFVAGIPALSADEVARARDALMDLYAALDPELQRHFINLHGVLGWAAELGRHPRILDAVAALIGPDVLLWKSKAFVKFPGPGHVAWHQDVPHWNLVPPETVTAWVALSDVTEENGCVRMLRGSHRAGSRASAASADPTSLLSAGLQFAVSPEEERDAVPVPLRAGEISLHHGMTVHGSPGNRTAAPRIGLALVYAPAHVRQSAAPDRHVVLVRGRDRNGGFFPADPPPEGDRATQLAAAAEYFAQLKSGAIAYNVR